MDKDGSGTLSPEELQIALERMGMNIDKVREIINAADSDKNGNICRPEFLAAIQSTGTLLSDLAKQTQREMQRVTTSSGGVHTYADEELAAFSDHINNVLGGDPDCAHLLPIDPNSGDLFDSCGDGILLSKFINCIVPNTIDERVLNRPKGGKPLTIFKVNENLNLMINAAKGIGVKVMNIGGGDIREVTNPALVLGLLWQMVKMHLLSDINLKDHPELMRLVRDGETLEDFLALSPEKILLRWINYHLAEAGYDKEISNFGADVKNCEAYTVVMNRINPNICDMSALQLTNNTKRAGKVIVNARSLGCRPFVKAKDISSGNKKLNLAFVADLFNQCPGLDPLEAEEIEELKKFGVFDDMGGDNREERQFRLWANCLGIKDFYMTNLFDDYADGLNLLHTIDAVEPGTVSWRKVEMSPKSVFKKNINNNYAIVLGKSLKLHLVGIGGIDITQKNVKLVLGFIWQLFRYHSLKFIRQLSDSGVNVDDAYLLAWANERVQEVGGDPISSFKDKSISKGLFMIRLVSMLNPDAVDEELITPGETDDDKLLNARYAISIARMCGCCVFCLPEDLVEAKHKMTLGFIAAVMAEVLSRGGELAEEAEN